MESKAKTNAKDLMRLSFKYTEKTFAGLERFFITDLDKSEGSFKSILLYKNMLNYSIFCFIKYWIIDTKQDSPQK